MRNLFEPMSPKPSKPDRVLIIENFIQELKEKPKIEFPPFFKIDATGSITYITESAKQIFLKIREVNLAIGDSCFAIIRKISIKAEHPAR